MLPGELKARALRRARQRGVSFGALVRESISAMLSIAPGQTEDSLLEDKALFDGNTPADLASNHDRYLYGPAE